MPHRILIVGGYGVFGSRIAQRLARHHAMEIIVAGRRRSRAEAFASQLAEAYNREVASAVIDAVHPDRAELARLAPSIVVNASGPFQAQDLGLAHAAVAIGAHYIDLADAGAFVMALSTHAGLDKAARERGVLVVTGASTVPAVTAAVLEHFAPRFARCEKLFAGISPGNSFDPGPATTASILGTLGRPFAMRRDGDAVIVHGWQGLRRHRFPVIGGRWFGYCDVPDLTLLPQHMPSLRTVDVRAGVEVSLFHLGLWALSWPARWGLIADPVRLAGPLLALKRRFRFLGSDNGAMFVEIDGVASDGQSHRIAWHLIARQGHGPFIPATPAVIVARKLADGMLPQRGAMACLGLFTLDEFLAEVADLEIEIYVDGRRT